jgi:glutamyl-tRNA(Gln) amidotransferase subunit E
LNKIAGPKDKIEFAIDAIVNRIRDSGGVPAETRAATQSGETIFLRPRPGSSRMYPETDIPPITVSKDELQLAKDNIPQSWDDAIAGLQKKYGLNAQLSEQIFDSEYLDIFESICSDRKNNPNYVASVLCSTITNLQRKGLDSTLLKQDHIVRSFELLSEQKITKESLEMIYEYIMSGKVKTVDEFVQNHLQMISDEELERIIGDLVLENAETVKRQGEHASGMLMGMAMKSLRGKASGEKISRLLAVKISKILESKN